MRTRFPGVVPCRTGCTACCHGPFDISVSDALAVRDAVAGLPGPERGAMLRRARAQLDRMRALEPSFEFPWDVAALGEARFDALVEAHAGDPCPALDPDGRCLIYSSRPMVCRIMGIGLLTGAGEAIEDACPIRDDFPGYRELPPQRFELEEWELLEAVAHRSAAESLLGSAESTGYETTVAGAALLVAP